MEPPHELDVNLLEAGHEISIASGVFGRGRLTSGLWAG